MRSNLKSQISNLKSQISNLKSQISNLKSQISNLIQLVVLEAWTLWLMIAEVVVQALGLGHLASSMS